MADNMLSQRPAVVFPAQCKALAERFLDEYARAPLARKPVQADRAKALAELADFLANYGATYESAGPYLRSFAVDGGPTQPPDMQFLAHGRRNFAERRLVPVEFGDRPSPMQMSVTINRALRRWAPHPDS